MAWLVGPTVGGFVARPSFFARIVLADTAFVAFLVAAVLMGMVYIQMYNSLSVYLRDNHGIQPQGYGVLLMSSAMTVIAFQFWTMRVITRQPQFLMMALGTVFYLIGFGMFGVVAAYWLFVLAVVMITAGEMIVVPTSQALAAGFVLDNYQPGLLWYLSALLCAISASGFYALHATLGSQPRFAVAPRHPPRSALAMVAEHG